MIQGVARRDSYRETPGLRFLTNSAFLCDPVGWHDGYGGRILLGIMLATVPGAAQIAETPILAGREPGAKRVGPARHRDSHHRCGEYSFTDRYLAEELAALARKGVRIRVYCDGGQFAQETQSGVGATTDILLSAGVQVWVNGAKDLMHLKSLCGRWPAAAHRLRD